MNKTSPLNIGWNPSLNSTGAGSKQPSEMARIIWESGRNRGSGMVTHSANDLALQNTKLSKQIEKWTKTGGYKMQVKINSAKKKINANSIKMAKMRSERRKSFSEENDDFGANPFAEDGGIPDYKDPSLRLGGIAGQPLETVNRSSTSNRNDYFLNPEAYDGDALGGSLQSPSSNFDPATTNAAANMFFGSGSAAFGSEALTGSSNNIAWQQNYTPTTPPLGGEEDDMNDTLTS